MPGTPKGMDMNQEDLRETCKPVKSQSPASLGPADAREARAGGAGGDAPPSNTASHSYNGDCYVKFLRIGVDSLYLSYHGDMGSDVEADLAGKKLQAQSRDPKERALAQWKIGDHIFEVSDKGQKVAGQGGFAYILEDNAYRICLASGSSRSLPLAYVKISSACLAHMGPEAAVEELHNIIDYFGITDRYPTISRIDLYADFQTNVDMESFSRAAWLTRAGSINTYSVKKQFSGYTIGQGGPISSRLYDKTLEIQSSHKTYFRDLWKRAGMNPDQAVWRQEFQINREVLTQLGIRSFQGLMQNLGGIWGYASHTWLCLTIPQDGDSNRARWPVHPLWEALMAVQWRLDDVPLTRIYSTARVPSADRLCSLNMSLLTSYMASQRLKGYEEGVTAFQAQTRAIHTTRAESKHGLSFEDWLAQEVAIKAKRFNTVLNVPGTGGEPDEEEDDDAAEYYRASRGE